MTIRLNGNISKSCSKYKIDLIPTLSSRERDKPKKNVYLFYFVLSLKPLIHKFQVYGVRYITYLTPPLLLFYPGDFVSKNRYVSLGSPNLGMNNSRYLSRVTLPTHIINEIRTIDPLCDHMIDPTKGL